MYLCRIFMWSPISVIIYISFLLIIFALDQIETIYSFLTQFVLSSSKNDELISYSFNFCCGFSVRLKKCKHMNIRFEVISIPGGLSFNFTYIAHCVHNDDNNHFYVVVVIRCVQRIKAKSVGSIQFIYESLFQKTSTLSQ